MAFVSVKFGLSERTACKLLGVERSSYGYEPRPERNFELREELAKLARQKRCRKCSASVEISTETLTRSNRLKTSTEQHS